MIFRRLYHVTAITYSVKRQGIKLYKLMSPGSKRKWHPNPDMLSQSTLPTIKSLTKIKREPAQQGNKRLAVLNKLFMKHITDIMSTGTCSMDIVGRGIEISKVSVSPDLHRVNVFWVSKGNDSDDDTERLLSDIAGPLRHELSVLRLMGEVPYIMFVKDRKEAKLVELDRRLSRADYGEDYTPTDLGDLFRDELCLETKLSEDVREKIKQLDQTIPVEEEQLPAMSHGAFGLDHKRIMNRLIAARKRSKDAWSNLQKDNAIISYRKPENSISDVDTQKQKQELAEFLKKRQVEQNKLHKELRRVPSIPVTYENDDDIDDQYRQVDDIDDYYEEDDDINISIRYGFDEHKLKK